MSSRFFIERPIFASVLSIVIVVVGLVALMALPIAQFPEITPPVVQIDADYPGASAEIVADAVARPIEVQLPGIDNLLYYDSTSTNDGHMTIRLTFEIGTNVDIAQVQTQNREKLAEPQLPPEVIRQGVSSINSRLIFSPCSRWNPMTPGTTRSFSPTMPSYRSSIISNGCPVSGMPRSSARRATACGWSWIPSAWRSSTSCLAILRMWSANRIGIFRPG